MVMHLRRCFALGIAVSISAIAQQQLKVKEDRGHVSPLRAKVTFKNDKTRDVVVQGVGMTGGSNYLTHTIVVRTEDGVSKRVLWLDSITSLSGLDKIRTTRSEFTVKLKDGSEIPAMFTIVAHREDRVEMAPFWKNQNTHVPFCL